MLVSIPLITYGHEGFIAQAIDSALNQNRNFDLEIILAEDGGPDNTRAICDAYAAKYPDIIRLSHPPTNIGMMPNALQALYSTKGKYIALLEGDDYFTDPNKLQKQVDFLEANPNYTVCFSNANMVFEDGKPPIVMAPYTEDRTFNMYDLLRENMIPTVTTVFRNVLDGKLPAWFNSDLAFGDWPIHILNAQYGLVKYLNYNMAAYRVHDSNTWANKELTEGYKAKISAAKISFYGHLLSHFMRLTTQFPDAVPIIQEELLKLHNQRLSNNLTNESFREDASALLDQCVASLRNGSLKLNALPIMLKVGLKTWLPPSISQLLLK